MVEHDKRANIFIDPKLGDIAFRQYAATWLAQHTGSDNTTRIYASTLDNHVSPAIGDVPLRKITREQVRTLLLETLPGKPVSRSVVEMSRQVITAVLGEAVRGKRITENPAAGIRLPAAVEAADFYVPSRAELELITGSLPGDWKLAGWLMRGCGLRIAEAFAVSTSSVPAAVLADLLHLSPRTAVHWARQAGADWSGYAAHIARTSNHQH